MLLIFGGSLQYALPPAQGCHQEDLSRTPEDPKCHQDYARVIGCCSCVVEAEVTRHHKARLQQMLFVIHVYIHLHTCKHRRRCICNKCVYMYTSLHAHVDIDTDIHVHVYIHIYLYVHAHTLCCPELHCFCENPPGA